jgi:hypothetical protein
MKIKRRQQKFPLNGQQQAQQQQQQQQQPQQPYNSQYYRSIQMPPVFMVSFRFVLLFLPHPPLTLFFFFFFSARVPEDASRDVQSGGDASRDR